MGGTWVGDMDGDMDRDMDGDAGGGGGWRAGWRDACWPNMIQLQAERQRWTLPLIFI